MEKFKKNKHKGTIMPQCIPHKTTIKTDPNSEVKFLEDFLKKQFEYEVEVAIRDIIMPDINKKIKQLATEAIRNWSSKINIEKSMNEFGAETNIIVNFTENIINKVIEERKINIQVLDRKQ